MCRCRRELSTIANSNEYLLAKFGFDTAENEPCKGCPLSVYRSPRFDISVDAELHNNYRDFKIPGFYSQYCSDHNFVDVRTAVIRAVDGA